MKYHETRQGKQNKYTTNNTDIRNKIRKPTDRSMNRKTKQGETTDTTHAHPVRNDATNDRTATTAHKPPPSQLYRQDR